MVGSASAPLSRGGVNGRTVSGRGATSHLVPALQTDDERTRFIAAWAIVMTGGDSDLALAVIEDALEHQDEEVRVAAEEAIEAHSTYER